MKKMDKPPFNDLAQPNMSEEAKAVMEYAMQRSCDEQAEVMKDVGDKNVTKNGQGKNVLRKEEHEKRQVRKTDKEKSLVDWTPEHEYETIKCNKTPEEERKFVDDAVKLITEQYGDVLKRLSKT